jgi:glutaminyl-peptide cyclotransferase
MVRVKRGKSEAVKGADRRATSVLWAGMLIGGILALAVLARPGSGTVDEETVTPVQMPPARPQSARPDALRARVLRRYPHDPAAFTQGLLWNDGVIYESTGRYGRSTLRRVQLEDGKVLAERRLNPKFFGEGLALVEQRLIQLTWRAGRAIVSDLATLEHRSTLRYRGEGWGLCFDGTSLVMSDGSSTLTFRDPATMKVRRSVVVRRRGIPVRMLNELECVGSDVYANVWRRSEILRIDGRSGNVTATIDAGGLLGPDEASGVDVLNGIAYRPETNTFLLTGKLWPTLFEVDFIPR